MVETAERTRPTQKGVSFRQRLCQGLELDPRKPHTGIISLLQETGNVVAVAIALEDSLRNNQPFNGTRPLSREVAKVLDGQLLSFAIEVVRKSEKALQVPPEEMGMEEDMGMEYVMLTVTLRLRAALGCSNTQAERYRFSRLYDQRLEEVTRQPK